MDLNITSVGKLLIFTGILLVIIGFLVFMAGKITGWPKLPGDILIKKDNFTFYFPIVTSIVISILLMLLLYLINKIR